MIEVFRCGNRWGWAMIAFCGRRIVWSNDRFDSDHAAAEAARAYRAAFWAVADAIDHRQARCI
jgi:hypothetical protein